MRRWGLHRAVEVDEVLRRRPRRAVGAPGPAGGGARKQRSGYSKPGQGRPAGAARRHPVTPPPAASTAATAQHAAADSLAVLPATLSARRARSAAVQLKPDAQAGRPTAPARPTADGEGLRWSHVSSWLDSA